MNKESAMKNPEIIIDVKKVNNIEMPYAKIGSGKRNLTILPGVSIREVTPMASAIAKQYSLFLDEFTIYVFDRRRNIPDVYDVWDMAEDTAQVMKALEIEKTCIFGASQGAMITMCIAITHPELVEKIVLGSTASRVNDLFLSRCEQWLSLSLEKKGKELVEAFGEAVYSETTWNVAKDALLQAHENLTEAEFHRFISLLRGTQHFDCYEKLSKIVCPVLVIGSEGDHVFGAEPSRDIANKLNCELYLYGENYGHGVYDEAPDYVARCHDFLA